MLADKPKLTWEQGLEIIKSHTDEFVSEKFCKKPVVSVSLVTFQHAEFVERAIQSILAQRTKFEFEVIIGDDNSRDGTIKVLKEYQLRFPDKIRLLVSSRNLGGVAKTNNGRLNLLRNLKNCRGQYIALLEGDDCWTDESKLQKQFDAIVKHPQCGGVAHRTSIETDDGSQPSEYFYPYNDHQIIKIEDTFVPGHTPFHTSSFFFRASLFEVCPDWILNALYFDRPLYTLICSQEPVYYLGTTMSLYRRHSGGITNTKEYASINFQLSRFELVSEMGRKLGLLESRGYKRMMRDHRRSTLLEILKKRSLAGLLKYLKIRKGA